MPSCLNWCCGTEVGCIVKSHMYAGLTKIDDDDDNVVEWCVVRAGPKVLYVGRHNRQAGRPTTLTGISGKAVCNYGGILPG